jgi:hypothetical protein
VKYETTVNISAQAFIDVINILFQILPYLLLLGVFVALLAKVTKMI